MGQTDLNEDEANAINEQMVRKMEERREQRPERRRQSASTPAADRRTICSYCFQPGDHRTPAQCLRALGG